MSTHTDTIYDQVVRITQNYLGPVSDDFIELQVKSHLHKAPKDLSTTDLSKLIDWIRVTVSLLTEDNSVIDDYTQELRNLSAPATKLKHSH